MRFVVVSNPAPNSSMTVEMSSRWSSWSPCSSTWISSESRSSVGCDAPFVDEPSNSAATSRTATEAASSCSSVGVDLERHHRGPDERLELVAVALRHAEHLADDRDRQPQRELGDHVDDAPSSASSRSSVSRSIVGPQVLDRLRGERLGHQPAQAGVVGRVEAEHRVGLLGEVAEADVPLLFGEPVVLPHRAGLALAEARVAQHPLAVGVAPDDHEVRARSGTPAPCSRIAA